MFFFVVETVEWRYFTPSGWLAAVNSKWGQSARNQFPYNSNDRTFNFRRRI
jgi:hypothetical protein